MPVKVLILLDFTGILRYNSHMENIILEVEKYKKSVEELTKENVELKALVKYYEEQYRLSQQKKFGSSSEKTPGQTELNFFDEAENESVKHISEPTALQITCTRRKREGKRDEDLSDLPVETITHSLPEEERICPECGGVMHVMGHSEPRRELKIIPAQVSVAEHVQEVYSCRECDKNNVSVPVIKAPAPEPTVKGGVASPSSVAHIMVQKYVNAMPLYRQEREFVMNGFMLSRQTMANWMIYTSERWLEPLYDMMKSNLLREQVLHADETVLQVLKEQGRKSRMNSYMWLYRTGGISAHPIVIYEYQETRSSSHPKKFLEGFKGYLHTDGYQGYHVLPQAIKVVGCWAHARRKFDEAVKSAPPEERSVLPSQKGPDFCSALFRLEHEYEKLNPEERYQARLERSKPLVGQFYAWVNSVGALPKSALGRAVHYALEQRPYLEKVFLDGRLELSNNRAERSIKPFVIGRKNRLFSATPKGAMASSVIYSVIETAKENGLKPFEYLKYLFETMPNISGVKLDSLLPWSDSLPLYCKLETK
ncbi:transposase [Synergistales bacterium]|nr:transposase [Synergistales bacterium]